MTFAYEFLRAFKGDALSSATVFDEHKVHIYACDGHISWIVRYKIEDGMVHVVHRPRKTTSVLVATFNPDYVKVKEIAEFIRDY